MSVFYRYNWSIETRTQSQKFFSLRLQILPIQLEYWNAIPLASSLNPQEHSTDTTGVLKRMMHFFCKYEFPVLFYRYNWSIETASSDSLSYQAKAIILPIQLEYWNYCSSNMKSTLPYILPIQLEYWNQFKVMGEALGRIFYRYNWSIETKF